MIGFWYLKKTLVSEIRINIKKCINYIFKQCKYSDVIYFLNYFFKKLYLNINVINNYFIYFFTWIFIIRHELWIVISNAFIIEQFKKQKRTLKFQWRIYKKRILQHL